MDNRIQLLEAVDALLEGNILTLNEHRDLNQRIEREYFEFKLELNGRMHFDEDSFQAALYNSSL